MCRLGKSAAVSIVMPVTALIQQAPHFAQVCLCPCHLLPPPTPGTSPPLSSSAGFRPHPVAALRLGVPPPQAPLTSHQPYCSSLSPPSSTPMCFHSVQSSLPELMSEYNATPLLDTCIPPPHEANGGAPRPSTKQDEPSLLGTQMADPSKVFVHRVDSGLKEGNQNLACSQIHGDKTSLSHSQSLPCSPKRPLVIFNGVSLG